MATEKDDTKPTRRFSLVALAGMGAMFLLSFAGQYGPVNPELWLDSIRHPYNVYGFDIFGVGNVWLLFLPALALAALFHLLGYRLPTLIEFGIVTFVIVFGFLDFMIGEIRYMFSDYFEFNYFAVPTLGGFLMLVALVAGWWGLLKRPKAKK